MITVRCRIHEEISRGNADRDAEKILPNYASFPSKMARMCGSVPDEKCDLGRCGNKIC